MKRFFTFTRAVIRLCWALLTRRPAFVSVDEANARINICHGCPYFQSYDRTCSVCECFVDAKSLFATEDCPKGYWVRIRDYLFPRTR